MADKTVVPSAVANPAGCHFNEELHAFYRDQSGNIWNSSKVSGTWSQQMLTGNGGVVSAATSPMGIPTCAVNSEVLCLYYCDSNGWIHQVTYDGTSWTPSRVTGPTGALPQAPASVGELASLFVSGSGETNVCFRDASGVVHGAYWNGTSWGLRTFNGASGGLTDAPAAACDPAAVAINGEVAVCYLDGSWGIYGVSKSGETWSKTEILRSESDAPVDPGVSAVEYEGKIPVTSVDGGGGLYLVDWSGGPTSFQYLNQTGQDAASAPRSCVYYSQLHVCYRGADSYIWDAVKNQGTWHLNPLTGPGSSLPDAPQITGKPAVLGYRDSGGSYEMHVVYCTGSGEVWDAYYIPTGTDGGWHKRRLLPPQ